MDGFVGLPEGEEGRNAEERGREGESWGEVEGEAEEGMQEEGQGQQGEARKRQSRGRGGWLE